MDANDPVFGYRRPRFWDFSWAGCFVKYVFDSTFGSEYGYKFRGVIEAITKSGSNPLPWIAF